MVEGPRRCSKPRPAKLTISPNIIVPPASDATRSWIGAASQLLSCMIRSPNGTAATRDDFRFIVGGVDVIMFDFDGTLTTTPGHSQKRADAVQDLLERASMLGAQLLQLRKAGILLGIISKSHTTKIKRALEVTKLGDHFIGPVVGNAKDIRGKAGLIEDLCSPGGALEHVGFQQLHRIVLVDDDVYQLSLARECGIQAFAAPAQGGLQEEDFVKLLKGLGIANGTAKDAGLSFSCREVNRIWTRGLIGKSLELCTDQTKVVLESSCKTVADLYEIHSEMGDCKGAFGTCFSCRHKDSGIFCVLKHTPLDRLEIRDKFLDIWEKKDVFNLLLKMSNEQRHPNVVCFLDYLLGPTDAYAIMEPLHGPELFVLLEETAPVTEFFCRRVMQDVLSALDHIHNSMRLIHRDVKVENLRFRTTSPESELVLLDFGFCCPAQCDEDRDVVGTLLYVAPEMFSRKYTTHVDLWSAGVVLYILLTGRPPWKLNANHGFCLSKAVMNGDAVRHALNSCHGAPPLAVELLGGLLELSPDHRLSAAAALQHAWFEIQLGPSCGAPKARPHADSLISVEKSVYGNARLQSKVMPTHTKVISDQRCWSFTDALAKYLRSLPLSLVL